MQICSRQIHGFSALPPTSSISKSFWVCLRMPIYAMDTSSRISDALASLVKHGQAGLETDNMSSWDVMLPALVGFSLPTSNLPNLSTFTILPMFSHICISMCHNKVAAWDTRSLIYLAVQYLPKDISQFVQFDSVQLTEVHRPEKVRRKARESNSKSWLVQFVC